MNTEDISKEVDELFGEMGGSQMMVKPFTSTESIKKYIHKKVLEAYEKGKEDKNK